jgi:endonuclease/exonuclease/phosphatase family metal-dependent hydrolase
VSFDEHLPDGDVERFRSGHVALLVELHPRDAPPGWTVVVVTTHLAWGDENEDIRLWQVRTLLRALQTFHNSCVLLCGDLNSVPGSEVRKALDQYFSSAYQDLEAVDGDSAIATSSHGTAEAGRGFAAVIDYCMVLWGGAWVNRRLRLPEKRLLRMWLTGRLSHEPIPTLLAGGMWPSDHLPVAADVVLWEELPPR